MEHNVRDTELTISKPADRSVPRCQGIHRITKKKSMWGADRAMTVKVVSPEEMEKLWR